jgi:hypothetical protein
MLASIPERGNAATYRQPPLRSKSDDNPHARRQFKAMTEPDRLALFETMGREAYGTQWKAAFARESGWSRRTVHNWLARGDASCP